MKFRKKVSIPTHMVRLVHLPCEHKQILRQVHLPLQPCAGLLPSRSPRRHQRPPVEMYSLSESLSESLSTPRPRSPGCKETNSYLFKHLFISFHIFWYLLHFSQCYAFYALVLPKSLLTSTARNNIWSLFATLSMVLPFHVLFET